jgi:endoglucanase Acf2
MFEVSEMTKYIHYIQAWVVIGFTLIWLRKPEYVDSAFERLIMAVVNLLKKLIGYILTKLKEM